MEFFIENRREILIGVISGLIVAVIIWLISKFQNIPPISVPVWLVVSVITIPLVALLLSRRPKKLKKVATESFGVERVFLDGKHFTDCTFDGSELVFKATAGMSMGHCRLKGTRITFQGAAALTVSQLSALYSDPGLRPIAEQALNDIVQRGKDIDASRSIDAT